MAYDAESKAQEICRIQSMMEAERSNWDVLWQTISEVCFPRAEQFTQKTAQGRLRGDRVFDTTPILALDRYAAVRDGLSNPNTEQWHGLETNLLELNKREDVKEYFELATDRLFDLRYAPHTNFDAQIHEYHLSDGAFGSGGVFVDESIGRHLRYRCMHMAELWFGESHAGVVDRVHRKLTLKAYQVKQKVEEEGWLMPERVAKALSGQSPNPLAEFDFIHAVYPNTEMDPGRLDWRGMAFRSCYVFCENKMIVKEGGYRTFPYAVGRHATGPRETYGRSPAMAVLRDILMLNEINKSMIRAAQMNLEPPLLVADEGALQPFQMVSGAVNYGYVDSNGEPLVQPLRPQGDLVPTLEMIQDRRTAVNDAFWITLFQILVDKPQITATEALLRAQEKGQLLGPSLSREQSEFWGTLIERELDILFMAGQLPPMPEALAREIEESGGEIKINYKAPINRLQQSGKVVGILRTFEALTPVAQVYPEVFDAFKGKGGEIGRFVAELQDFPATLMNSDEEIEALKEEESAQQSLGELVNAAPIASRVAKDIAQAQATAANVPAPIPLVQPA